MLGDSLVEDEELGRWLCLVYVEVLVMFVGGECVCFWLCVCVVCFDCFVVVLCVWCRW